MNFYFLAICIGSALSGKACLNADTALVQWKISELEIEYTLTLSEQILDQCDWLSIGFFFPEPNDLSADVNVVVLEQYVTDGYLNASVPGIDDKNGANNDIISSSYDLDSLTHRWSKLLKTSDVDSRFDILLYENEELVMYTYCGGIVDGEFVIYGPDYLDIFNVVLDDRTYNCDNLISQE